MNSLTKFDDWTFKHHHKWLDILRIFLGLILIAKGIAFIANSDQVILMITDVEQTFFSFVIAHYVIAGYLVGGIAITIGLITRVAVIFEIPSVLGSMIFVELHKNLFALNSELGYSLLILALLVFYFFYGSGTISFDYLIKQEEDVKAPRIFDGKNNRKILHR